MSTSFVRAGMMITACEGRFVGFQNLFCIFFANRSVF